MRQNITYGRADPSSSIEKSTNLIDKLIASDIISKKAVQQFIFKYNKEGTSLTYEDLRIGEVSKSDWL